MQEVPEAAAAPRGPVPPRAPDPSAPGPCLAASQGRWVTPFQGSSASHTKDRSLGGQLLPAIFLAWPHIPGVFYKKRVLAHASQRPGRLQVTWPGSCLYPEPPRKHHIPEGVTSPHSSSRKPPRQLASVRKKAPGRPCREESSGSNMTPAGDMPFKAALPSRPGQNAAIREVTGGHSGEQTQNPQLARNLPLKIPAKARPILSSRGAVR